METEYVLIIDKRFCDVEARTKELERNIATLAEAHIKLERVVTTLISAISGTKIKHYMDAENE